MKSLLLFIFCFGSLIGYGQYLVKDLHTAPKSSNPREFTLLYSTPNYYTYFIADAYDENNLFVVPYIWCSVNGTTPIRIPNSEGAAELAVIGTTLYFVDGFALNKLTSPTGPADFIAWIFPQSGFDYDTHDLTVSGNRLYFLSNNSLWTSLGTEATTAEISTSVINPQGLTAINLTQSNSVVLSAENSSGDREMVVCNGSTVVRYDINPSGDSNPNHFADVFSIGVLFSANNGSNGSELFKYNGSTAPTLVKNINPSGSSDPKVLDEFTNNVCYFAATTDNEGRELWRTDGSSAGTVLVEDINPGTASSDPNLMIARGGRLFFAATHPNTGRELWVSQGTAATTSLFYNFAPDIFLNNAWITASGFPTFLSSSNFSSPASFYIYAQSNSINKNLYNISSSTQQGTQVNFVKTLFGIPLGGIETGGANTILFGGFDVENGQELWKSNGTEAGTALFTNVYTEPIGSYPTMSSAVSLGNTLIFSANDGVNGREVFRSDGTDANTVLLKDCFTGPNSSLPSNFTKISNYVYFSAFGGPEPDWKGGTELWRTDGTTAGTVFIKDVNNSHVSSNPRNFKGYNNEAYFVATTAGLADQIYKTNGTIGNTSYITSVSDDDYEILQGFLMYKKYSPAAGKMEVWTKNLTSGIETKVFTPTFTNTDIQILFNAGSYVIFSADDHLYSYNGTAITEILDTQFTAMFTSVSGVVYFMARFGNEKRIYKTNGTAAGTLLVKTFPNPLTQLHSLTNVNGTLYFAINIPAGNNYAGDQIINGYLYKSDGTEAGTVVVRTYADANKKLGIMMNSLTAGVGDELFYVVEQTILLDPNLITSDNVPKNTLIVDKLTTAPDAVRDIIKVGYNLVLPQMSKSVLVNNHLFFAFNDRKESKGGFGNELWAYRRDCPGNVLVNRATPPDIGRTFNSANTITGNAKIFANETVMDGAPRYDKERFPVTFRATDSVTLLPGFEASTNKVFKAEIGGCN